MVQITQMTLRDRIQQIEDAISAGQIDEAMNDCQQILTRFPHALEIQRLLGEIYLAQGRLEEAQQTFDWILINDPENVIVYCDRALICEHQSDLDTALDCYQQAYELSRGNSQIRQEFNALSKRAGQQEFMLSRAGLARLYMRGHLLTQAIQEWEAVLAVSPDRLDARLGLLETCWREGLYEEVERMASRILEEVPQCLKALLLMAHVTSAYNLQRARDLIARATMLDPELMMAQDLFSDVIGSQPNDPFLTLITKEPIELPDKIRNGNGKTVDTINTLQYAAIEVISEESPEGEQAAENVYAWGDVESWSELDTRTIPQTNTVSQAPEKAHGDFHEIPAITEAGTSLTFQPPSQAGQIDDFETWAKQQEIDDDFDPALLEKQPWFQAEQQAIPDESATPVTQATSGSWDTDNKQSAPNTTTPAREPEFMRTLPESSLSEAPWNTYTPRDESVAPPAWLDMLTNFERRQSASLAPSQPLPRSETISAQQQGVSPEQQELEPATPASHSWSLASSGMPVQDQQEVPPLLFSSNTEDEDLGWPEWLKSLGAEAMEPDAVSPDSSVQQPASSDSWGDTSVQEPTSMWHEPEPGLREFPAWADMPLAETQNAPDAGEGFTWTAQIEQPAPVEKTGQTTVETAHDRESAFVTTLEALEQSLLTQGFVPLQPGSLSAIAQDAPPPATTAPLAPSTNEGTQHAAQEEATTASAAEVQPAASEPQNEQAAQDEPAQTAVDLPPGGAQPQAFTTANRQVEATGEQAVPATPPEAEQTSPNSLEMLLDSELETTMRRPAVRLQPMQATPSPSDRPYAPAARSIDYSARGPDSKLSNKERLVKGYQLQLAGAYDDAMQDYRILIRNAPELLSEVISNVRALLKLAPKYTAGYRVLGDAYMRQGEYLQAMDAYNKALTIAKKAKSQSR